jgi:hypothetical protein
LNAILATLDEFFSYNWAGIAGPSLSYLCRYFTIIRCRVLLPLDVIPAK